MTLGCDAVARAVQACKGRRRLKRVRGRVTRLLRRQLSEEELRRERRRRQPKHYVTSALVEMFVTCSTRTSGASGCTTVQDKNGRMRVLTHNVSLTGRDVSMHGRTIHGSTSSGQGGLEVAMQAMLMTEHAALRLALLCLLALVTEHECARRRLARSEGKAVIFTLTQVSPASTIRCRSTPCASRLRTQVPCRCACVRVATGGEEGR